MRMGGEHISLSPIEVKFSQDTVAMHFRDRYLLDLNTTCEEIVKGNIKVSSIPKISVAKEKEAYYSNDNRRLYVFRVLYVLGRLKTIEVVVGKKVHPFKKTSTNGGCHVKLRDGKDNNEKTISPEIYRHCYCKNNTSKLPEWWNVIYRCHEDLVDDNAESNSLNETSSADNSSDNSDTEELHENLSSGKAAAYSYSQNELTNSKTDVRKRSTNSSTSDTSCDSSRDGTASVSSDPFSDISSSAQSNPARSETESLSHDCENHSNGGETNTSTSNQQSSFSQCDSHPQRQPGTSFATSLSNLTHSKNFWLLIGLGSACVLYSNIKKTSTFAQPALHAAVSPLATRGLGKFLDFVLEFS